MLGSEYNWLIRFSRPTHGAPRVTLVSGGLLTLAIAAFCLLCLAARAESPATAQRTDVATWSIPAMDGIIESVALDPATHRAFFGDVHNRCIWERETDGGNVVMKRFSAESDGLLGVFALKVSADGRTLWASSSALPEMKGYAAADLGRGLLAAYDLPTRKLRSTYPLPAEGRAHVLGDFILAGDGTIYATDSTAPIIWRLSRDGTRLEKWLENAQFKSLQGLVLAPDQRTMWVADYSRGLWRVDLRTATAVLLPAPDGSNLRGIDGLYATPGGLIGVQNGLNPQRIIRLVLDSTGTPTRLETILSGQPEMTDLSLGQVVGDRFQFVANSGWELFANPAATPAARPVTIIDASLR